VDKERRLSTGARATPRIAILALAASGPALATLGPTPLQAQEGGIPQFPAGVPVVVFPVQSATPLVDGSWPGDQLSLDKTLETMDAELGFAFGETRSGDMWVPPPAVIRETGQNPLIGVDPERLAYQGLLNKPKAEEQIYEPLHTQLRRVAALFDARFVVLPLRLGFEPLSPTRKAEYEEAAGSEGLAEAEPAAEYEEAVGEAVLLVALIDVRRSAVMWHGHIRGEASSVHSPALLATLASRVAYLTSPP
jgi:hypothetical protein